MIEAGSELNAMVSFINIHDASLFAARILFVIAAGVTILGIVAGVFGGNIWYQIILE